MSTISSFIYIMAVLAFICIIKFLKNIRFKSLRNNTHEKLINITAIEN